jgi:hypothetical protein
MSIVSVHGPNTWGSRAVQETGPVLVTVDPTNGLKWDFNLDTPSPRPDQDFSWAFPTDGTPTPQTVQNPAVVTYATPGSKTATMTVTNVSRTVSNKALTSNVATLTTSAAHGFKVGQLIVVSGVDAVFNGNYTITATPSGTTFTYDKVNANVTSAASGGTVASDPTQYPTAGAYPITVAAVTGTGPAGVSPLSMEGGDGGEEPPPEEPDVYDPGDYTVAEVEAYVEAYPDQLEEVLDAEEAGKNRSTLVAWLEARLAE